MSKINLNKNIKTLYKSKYINIFEQKYFRTKSLITDNYNDSYNSLFFIYKIINVLTQMSMEQDLSNIYKYIAEKSNVYKDKVSSKEILKLYINKCYDDAIQKLYNLKNNEFTNNNNSINIPKEEEDINTNIIKDLNQMNNQFYHDKYIEYLNDKSIVINKYFIHNINNMNPSDIIDTLIQNQNERFILDTLIAKSKFYNNNENIFNNIDDENIWFNEIKKIRFKIHKYIPDIINKIKFNHKMANNKIINNHNNPKRNISNNKYDKWENNKYHKQIIYKQSKSKYFGSEDIDLKYNVLNSNQTLNWKYKNNNNDKINVNSDIKFYLKYNYIYDYDTRNNIRHVKNENGDANTKYKDRKDKIMKRNNKGKEIKIIKYYQDKHYNNWYRYDEE